MHVKLIRFRDDLIPPKRAHYDDAGADVYLPETVYIPKGERKRIPLGFGVEIPNGYMGVVHTRSSNFDKGLLVDLSPIDAGYRGEIHVLVSNYGREMAKLERGTRVAQLVIQPVALPDFVEDLGSERGSGAFGSTGE